jgi:cytoskeleton protein RodZ
VNEASGPVDAPVPAATQGPGAILARGRKDKRLTVDDVAARLKFAPRQIAALESDDFDKLPGTTFIRGMIRNYARLLDTDAAPLLEAYERCHVHAPVTVDLRDENIPFPDGRARSTRIYLALSVLIVTAMAAVLYEWQYGLPPLQRPSAPVAPVDFTRIAAAEATPIGDVPPAAETFAAQPAAQPPAAERMVFEFGGPSWVEVKDRDGKTLLARLNEAGTRQVVEGEGPFSVVIGNASHVRLLYRNQPVDLQPHIRVEVARMKLD